MLNRHSEGITRDFLTRRYRNRRIRILGRNQGIHSPGMSKKGSRSHSHRSRTHTSLLAALLGKICTQQFQLSHDGQHRSTKLRSSS